MISFELSCSLCFMWQNEIKVAFIEFSLQICSLRYYLIIICFPKGRVKKARSAGYVWPATNDPDYANGTVCLSLTACIEVPNNTVCVKSETIWWGIAGMLQTSIIVMSGVAGWQKKSQSNPLLHHTRWERGLCLLVNVASEFAVRTEIVTAWWVQRYCAHQTGAVVAFVLQPLSLSGRLLR